MVTMTRSQPTLTNFGKMLLWWVSSSGAAHGASRQVEEAVRQKRPRDDKEQSPKEEE